MIVIYLPNGDYAKFDNNAWTNNPYNQRPMRYTYHSYVGGVVMLCFSLGEFINKVKESYNGILEILNER